ncbi:MAG: hypothetical protein II998_02525 [Clostridia bacterium]|nr:hypothetical protein [Clostridia bacterium]
MKKFLSIILAVAMLIPCFSAMAETNTDLTIVKEIIPANSETPVYREMTSTEEGKAAAQVVVPASAFENSESINVYFAKYASGNQLEAVKVATVTSDKADTPVITEAFDITEESVVKAFAWNGTTITPLSTSVALPKKTTHIVYDFEDDTEYPLDTAVTNKNAEVMQARKDCNNVTIVNDPLGQNGKVVKFDATKGSTAANFIEGTTYRPSINKFLDKTSSTVEFDFYMPNKPSRKVTATDEEGNPTAYSDKDLYFRLNFGSVFYSQIQIRATKAGGHSNRLMINTNSAYGTLVANKYCAPEEFYGKWNHFKLTYAPCEGNNEACEYYLWLNDELIYHSIGLDTKVTNRNYVARNLYIGTYQAAGYLDENSVFYIDNVKFSA